jgi:hypothetical protein
MSVLCAHAPSPLSTAASFASRVLGSWTSRRWRAPRIALLCMDFDAYQRARAELRIVAPATAADWTLRRIERLGSWPVGLAHHIHGAASPALDTALSPRRSDGRWFAGDASVWLTYAADTLPPHRVVLRLTLERDGRQRTVTVSAVFPAMAWTAEAAPSRRQQPPARVDEPRPDAATLVEAVAPRPSDLAASP